MTNSIDFEDVLAPVSGDNIAGEPLGYDDVLVELQEARREDDAALPQGSFVQTLKSADWERVEHIARGILRTRSKDLEVACYLAEALAGQHGFRGVAAGISFIAAMFGRFGDVLHPNATSDEYERRVALLLGFSNKLAEHVRRTPFVGRGTMALAWIHWNEAAELRSLRLRSPEQAEEVAAAGKTSPEAFDEAAAVTPMDDLKKSQEAVEDCARAYSILGETLKKTWIDGGTADPGGAFEAVPDLRELQSAITGCTVAIRAILQARGADYHTSMHPDLATTGDLSPRAVPVTSPAMPAQRLDALKQLQQLSNFFRLTEPQSPVSYLIDRAIRWASTPLPDWIDEVIQDEVSRRRVKDLIGIERNH